MIVERIEDGVAVLEGETESLEVPASWLPGEAREGSVLRIDIRRDAATSRLTLTVDAAARSAREAELREVRESIPEGPGGDLEL